MKLTAKEFINELKSFQSDAEKKKIRRYFQEDDADNQVIGVRMKRIFDLAKDSADMPLNEVSKLLDSPYYEARMGAVSIMDFQARRKSTTDEHRKELFELYISRHDRINSWDFVDRSAPHVVGGYLQDKPRDILCKLARSENIWERRTAIVATWFFIRKGELDDTYEIAEILADDEEVLIQKAVGSWIREAGKRDEQRLLGFLEKHAAGMPRPMLTKAVEKLDKKQKEYFRNK
ncbi:MAG: DNA alkylation repair protein [Balneolaceae bacterium]|nr:DNA alkylation repair protein [Balneolaceae bacterium]